MLTFLVSVWGGSCSTTEMQAQQAANPPVYVGVPHPIGFDLADLDAVFLEPGAPEVETLKDCDAKARKLQELARTQEELTQGMRELVKSDPTAYHWCFYGKIVLFERQMKDDKLYVDEKQTSAIETFHSLTPLARAFMAEFADSRYLRWALQRYKHAAQYMFYRKLEVSARMSAELVDASRPFGLWRAYAEKKPVLEKYHLVDTAKELGPTATAPATAPAPTAPAAETAQGPTPETMTANPTPVTPETPASQTAQPAPTEQTISGGGTQQATAPTAPAEPAPAAPPAAEPARAPAAATPPAPAGAASTSATFEVGN